MKTPMYEMPQLDAMRMGVEYKFAVKCRGLNILMRPLSSFEIVQAAHNVADRLSDMQPHKRAGVVESLLLAGEKLELASTSDVNANDPQITKAIIERMTPDEVDYLWKQYCLGCERVNPSLEKMSTEEVAQLVAEVKKNPARMFQTLIDLSSLQLANICHLLLQNSEGSQTDKSLG